MSTYVYGMRFDDDSNAITVIDEENQTAATTGYINGEPVDFSGGGGSSDFSTAQMTISGFPSGIGGGVNIGGFAEIEDGALMFISDITSFPNGTYVVVLYQGTTCVTCFDSITVSGDAEYDGEESITATGDFTISPLS